MHKVVRIAVATGMVFMVGAHAAWGQTSSSAAAARSVEQLVRALGAESYEVRESAARRLMLRENLTPGRLNRAYRRAESPEVRHRLVRIARHRFFSADHIPASEPGKVASLGVAISSDNIISPKRYDKLDHPAFVVIRTLPGFPAYAHLRRGDWIVSINGKPFSDDLSVRSFAARIKQYQPGEKVVLGVVRDDARVRIELKLASFARLHELYGPRAATEGRNRQWQRKWHERLERLRETNAEGKVIDWTSQEGMG